MSQNKMVFYALGMVTLFLVVWIFGSTFTQPSVADLEGEFVETANYRNENNTGPVIRLYAVEAADTLWHEMQAYGDFMPHTKYGNTKVFFFAEASPTRIQPTQPFFSEDYNSQCLAVYEKTAMGEVKFRRYPFTTP